MSIDYINHNLHFVHVKIENTAHIGMYLVLTYIERLISTGCYFFSCFYLSVNCMSWVCKSHNFFMIFSEIGTIFKLKNF